jgi:hypothetical protein
LPSTPKIPLRLARTTPLPPEDVPIYFLVPRFDADLAGFKARLTSAGLFADRTLQFDPRGGIQVLDRVKASSRLPWLDPQMAARPACLDDSGRLYAPQPINQPLTIRTVEQHRCPGTELIYTNNVGQQFQVHVWNAPRLQGVPSRFTLRFEGQLLEDWFFAYPLLLEYQIKDEGAIALFVASNGVARVRGFGVREPVFSRTSVSLASGELQSSGSSQTASVIHRFLDLTNPIQILATNRYGVWELPQRYLHLFHLHAPPDPASIARLRRQSPPYDPFAHAGAIATNMLIGGSNGRLDASGKRVLNELNTAQTAAQQAITPELMGKLLSATNNQDQQAVMREFTTKLIMENPNLSDRQKRRMIERMRKQWEK